MNLPRPERRSSHRIFWLVYWMWFFALLPWMILRQVGVTLSNWWFAWRTTGRRWSFFGGDLEIGFVGSYELLVTAGMFGERFTWLRWRDVVIDPGPARTRRVVMEALSSPAATEATPTAKKPLSAVVCTHFHEEHIGNAAAVARVHGIPVWGSDLTLAAVRQPPVLPDGRMLLMGQAEPAGDVPLELLGAGLETANAHFQVISSPGHCRGHVALFEPQHGILFAGDSFLHELFTSPNADSDSASWITTLEAFSALPVQTLIGSHGAIISCDPTLPVIPGVVVRGDPARMIASKLTFLRWSAEMVAEGERCGLSHSVIEARLFPWQRSWSWRTWFHDEGFRLLTCGEFSRTHYVRSLSREPMRVPVRFPLFHRLGAHLARLGPELLRIHVLAARLESVSVIASSILLSGAVAWTAAVVSHAFDGSGSGSSGPVVSLVIHQQWLALALVFAVWTWWWAVIGGAITRRMAMAVAGTAAEPWPTSLRWCLRPAMLVPSAMASLCLLAIGLAPHWPWLVLGIPPVWLVAGFLYGALCLEREPLSAALRLIAEQARHPLHLAARQAEFLLGFAVSTGLVYAIAGMWWLLVTLITGSWTSLPALVLSAPALFFALGYTTANLKSLQLRLYLRARAGQ